MAHPIMFSDDDPGLAEPAPDLPGAAGRGGAGQPRPAHLPHREGLRRLRRLGEDPAGRAPQGAERADLHPGPDRPAGARRRRAVLRAGLLRALRRPGDRPGRPRDGLGGDHGAWSTRRTAG
ncbi:hypothetical protein [Nocardioides convexus]|uniref:hypothetical protein n=1 Tax=Nocardioides convexus TaxID=2712224 RepID=UPI0024187BC3|nr:hypothetical protein [Nocardioides convexus]